MKEFWLILEELRKRNIYFCFQSHAGSSEFYNLAVRNPRNEKNTLYLHSETVEKCEQDLKILWGHILEKSPSVAKIPTPSGFPMPSM